MGRQLFSRSTDGPRSAGISPYCSCRLGSRGGRMGMRYSNKGVTNSMFFTVPKMSSCVWNSFLTHPETNLLPWPLRCFAFCWRPGLRPGEFEKAEPEAPIASWQVQGSPLGTCRKGSYDLASTLGSFIFRLRGLGPLGFRGVLG